MCASVRQPSEIGRTPVKWFVRLALVLVAGLDRAALPARDRPVRVASQPFLCPTDGAVPAQAQPGGAGGPEVRPDGLGDVHRQGGRRGREEGVGAPGTSRSGRGGTRQVWLADESGCKHLYSESSTPAPADHRARTIALWIAGGVVGFLVLAAPGGRAAPSNGGRTETGPRRGSASDLLSFSSKTPPPCGRCRGSRNETCSNCGGSGRISQDSGRRTSGDAVHCALCDQVRRTA